MFKGSVLLTKLTNATFDTQEIRSSLHIFVVILVIVLILQWLLKYWNELRSLPPGPWGLPVIGYLPFMGQVKHLDFMDLAKKYGSVFSAKMGNQLTVVISDYKLIRENFRKTEYSSRPDTPLMQTIEGYGIINSVGKLWKDERRFLHEKLRVLGMTYMGSEQKKMEKRIMTEVNSYLSELTKSNGEPINVEPILAIASSNVICDLLMSVRFHKDCPLFHRFNFLIHEGMRLFGEIILTDFLPIIQYLPNTINAKNKIAQNRREMFDFYRTVIDDHKKTFDPNNLRDLVDIYLNEINQAKEEGRGDELFEGKDHEQQLMQVISDLFSAGNETVKTTLLWTILFMLHHPEVMAKVKEELDTQIGRDRLPTIDDLPHLPYTESTLLEGMRQASIVPLATTHSTSSSMEMNGFTIPAGVQVIPLISSIHMDPTLWDKPEEFNPERFIDEHNKVHRPEYFMPFGVGRRRCLGDTLARMEMFLFFASTLHAFDISLPAGEPLPSLEGQVSAVITPQSFRICLKPRPLNLDINKPEVDVPLQADQMLHHLQEGILRNVGSN